MSSILPYALWRGCASSFPLPIDRDHMRQANELRETLSRYNPDIEIEYRTRGHDTIHHVFRWDLTPYERVFENGFRARDRDHNTPENDYYSLEHHVRRGGRPGTSTRRIPHVFVSTSLRPRYYTEVGRENEIYRYEIYAPGGIWVAQTLGERYPYDRQDEVAFVAGIAPQYIRSAQRFRAIDDPRNRGRRIWRPADTQLIVHTRFNPQPSSYCNIQNPLSYCIINGERVDFTIIEYPPRPDAERRKREVSASSSTIQDWYAEDVAKIETYIDAAFRSSKKNEAYLFMQNEYVLVDYAPGSTGDKVLKGPLPICDGFPSLGGTAFADYGIDCAFRSHDENEAFIFSGNLCAHIDHANDKIIKGPTTIAKMFPFFKGTVFENGVDAAFESSVTYEAYIFKDNYYALINYGSEDSHLIAIRRITEGFASFKGTIFESGIDAAFTSHKVDEWIFSRADEAYIFKGDSYALINFAPATTDDYIIGGVKKILPDNWPSLRSVLPWKNRGLVDDDAYTTMADSDHYLDEVKS